MPAPVTARMHPPLPGFEHIRRSWVDRFDTYGARLLPGQLYVTRNPEAVYTTLGSCIAACIRDRQRGIGGMNHFMLPSSGDEDWRASSASTAARYGNYAMEHLINEIMRNGGQRANLEVKIFGGGRILTNMTDIGERNIRFVRDYLAIERLTVLSEDVGDIYPRMVVYFPTTGLARVKRLRSLHNNTIAREELRYIDSIKQQPVAGDVELF